MVLVNGGFLHCRVKEILVNSSLKVTKTKLARAISKNQVSDPGPSWPSCFKRAKMTKLAEISRVINTFVDDHGGIIQYARNKDKAQAVIFYDDLTDHFLKIRTKEDFNEVLKIFTLFTSSYLKFLFHECKAQENKLYICEYIHSKKYKDLDLYTQTMRERIR